MNLGQHEASSFIATRTREFSNQIDDFNEKILPENLFAQLRLRNGLYDELHSYMLRVAIPYGNINSTQLHSLAEASQQYDRGYGHFTTRQNIQFDWQSLDTVPKLLKHINKTGLHSVQTSGSCIRNIALDPLAGFAKDEYTDPRPYCEIIRQWAEVHPEFSWLPKKLKMGVTAAKEDRANIQFNDIGIAFSKNKNNQILATIYAGGGLGRQPLKGTLIADAIDAKLTLVYLDAILHIYNLYGRRDTTHKSRIKILVASLGGAVFKEKVVSYIHSNDRSTLHITQEQLNQEKHHFSIDLPETSRPLHPLPTEPEFLQWLSQNSQASKFTHYHTIEISLKNHGYATGTLPSQKIHVIASLAKFYSNDIAITTLRQNILLPLVHQNDLFTLWQRLKEHHLHQAYRNTLFDVVHCPGTALCSLADAKTDTLSTAIVKHLETIVDSRQSEPLNINISGCINACSQHHLADIGILGLQKSKLEYYQIVVGGSSEKIGQRIGPSLNFEDTVQAVGRLVLLAKTQQKTQQSLSETLRAINLHLIKEHIYG